MSNNKNEENINELFFHPLDIRSLEDIKNDLFECQHMLCDYTPGGLLFGIRSLYRPLICKAQDNVFISVLSSDGSSREFLMPLTPSEKALDLLHDHAKRQGIPLIFDGLTQESAKLVSDHFGCPYEMTDKLSDYVYDASSLASLIGSSYQTHRTNIRKLEREHQSRKYTRITEENKADALEFAHALFDSLSPSDSPFYEAGVDIVYDSIENLSELGFCSGMLYVDGKVAGIATGSVKKDMLYIHVLRADRKIWGAWNLLCREFVADNLQNIKYVNMEDDLNDPGIRRMKASYAPIYHINRCRIVIETNK